MKLFKIDEKVLFEKHFYKMTFLEFFSLDSVPKDVEINQMRNLGDFLKQVIKENPDIDFDNVQIGKVFEELYIQHNELENNVI